VNAADYGGGPSSSYNESLELAIKTRPPRNEALSRQNLGVCYIEQRDARRLKLVGTGTGILRQVAIRHNSFKSYRARKSVSTKKGLRVGVEIDGRKEGFERAIRRSKRPAYVLGEIGSIYVDLADYSKALDR